MLTQVHFCLKIHSYLLMIFLLNVVTKMPFQEFFVIFAYAMFQSLLDMGSSAKMFGLVCRKMNKIARIIQSTVLTCSIEIQYLLEIRIGQCNIVR